MSRHISISGPARNDMLELANYLAHDSVDVSDRFLDRVWETAVWLRTSPGAGTMLRSRVPRLAGLRRWPVDGFPNHLIIYRASDAAIIVERVFHGASNWRDRMRRESKRR
jgi:toxin ParE1/3/4